MKRGRRGHKEIGVLGRKKKSTEVRGERRRRRRKTKGKDRERGEDGEGKEEERGNIEEKKRRSEGKREELQNRSRESRARNSFPQKRNQNFSVSELQYKGPIQWFSML